MATGKKRSRLALIAFLLALLWLPGLAWFYQLIPVDGDFPDTTAPSDAIVVLTGGMGRIEKGVELLERNRAKMLLISGVDKDVKPEELVAEFGIDTQHPVLADGVSRMQLDYGPRDTAGNAQQTAKWMRENGLRSLRLVTSSYHMPRSMLEFRHAMPDMVILPAPVMPDWENIDKVVLVPRGSLRLILLEYHKYILRRLYYALPESLQLLRPRTSHLRPMADVGFGASQAQEPAAPPAQKTPEAKKETPE